MEAFSVMDTIERMKMDTIERMNWLASTPEGFDLNTDHSNIVFLFNPLTLFTDLSQSYLRKFDR